MKAMIAQAGGYIQGCYVALKQILNVLTRPIWLDPGANSLRVNTTSGTITTVTTVTTVTTCAAVTSVSQFAGFDAKQTVLYDMSRQTYGICVRGRIT